MPPSRDSDTLAEELYQLTIEEIQLLRNMGRVQDQIRELIGDKADISQGTNIHSLPPEMLLEIFQLACTYEPGISTPPYLRTASRMPVTLSRVCSLWRCLALGDSTLWTFLDFTQHGPKPLKALLRRSGQQKLNVARTWDLTDKFRFQ